MARRIRVLVADDNEDARNAYATYLAQQGMDVRTAVDGAAALELAHSFRPDVAILDLSMPKMTGDDVTREIRRDGVDPAILVLSGFGPFGERRALDAGADEYRSKPCLPHELAAIVERLARGRARGGP